jgi:large subunit ribosomal protein L5
MDVCMALSRPGYRISRKRNKSSIGKSHRITREDAIGFLKHSFGVEIA